MNLDEFTIEDLTVLRAKDGAAMHSGTLPEFMP
jgi:hypothetical protein